MDRPGGAELTGTRTTSRLRRGELLEHTEQLGSGARVLAVYPGPPVVVVTDAAPITAAPSTWANPFTVVSPGQVVLFDA